MVLILVIHTYGHGSGLNYHWIYSLGTQPDTAWNLALFSLGQIGVTGFIFISGYFGIRLSAKSLCHLLGMVLFYAVLMGIMTKSFSLHYLISLLYPFNSWWFVSSYLVIMLVAPIVEKGISQISQKQFLLIMAGLIYYCYFMRFLTKAVGQDTLMLFTVYLFARYMRYYPSSIFCKICRLGGGYKYSCDYAIPYNNFSNRFSH